jgi:hypothetical protein
MQKLAPKLLRITDIPKGPVKLGFQSFYHLHVLSNDHPMGSHLLEFRQYTPDVFVCIYKHDHDRKFPSGIDE